jgi:hypothetical protein
VNDTEWFPNDVAADVTHWTREMRTFTGYPMAALTERAQANISMTYPVVI